MANKAIKEQMLIDRAYWIEKRKTPFIKTNCRVVGSLPTREGILSKKKERIMAGRSRNKGPGEITWVQLSSKEKGGVPTGTLSQNFRGGEDLKRRGGLVMESLSAKEKEGGRQGVIIFWGGVTRV